MTRTFKTLTGVSAQHNLNEQANKAEAQAAQLGVDITAKVTVYENDGSKNWAGELACYLCEHPKDASKTRAELALIVQSLLGVSKFSANRLSMPSALGAKAKEIFVIPVLKANGYGVSQINTGMDIAKTIVAGKTGLNVISLDSKIKVELDGISVFDPRKIRPSTTRSGGSDGWTKYPYVPDPNASTALLWHRVLVQMPNRAIRLVDFLAVRGMGINEFATLDEAAHSLASARQSSKRAGLMAATAETVKRVEERAKRVIAA
ncbi:hypothetical protein [Caballeronia sp. S22]|uniref:hypothetical protein n=1 Tax=Caballeronia sp. S22 TaxID=3137182 RepID=UPI0035309B03